MPIFVLVLLQLIHIPGDLRNQGFSSGFEWEFVKTVDFIQVKFHIHLSNSLEGLEF